MSTKGVRRVECPHCSERFEADFWTVVRGDRDHDLKEMLISGELDILMCPGCSAMIPCGETFIYLDPGKELFVFVIPESGVAEKEKLLEKMRADYDAVKASLLRAQALCFEPVYFFGSAELANFLLRDRDMEEETEVMEFIAAEKKFKTAAIRPSFAREHDLPFSLPYLGDSPCKDSALAAAGEIAVSNGALARVKNLLGALNRLEASGIEFLKRPANAT